MRPLFQRGDQGVLTELLGESDVPGDPGQPGDQPAGLDAPDRLDRAPGGVGAALVGRGGRHGADQTTDPAAETGGLEAGL